MATFDSVIVKLAKNPDFHAKFVNSISLLEYMGARKILKSQRMESISADLLAHAAEEIRHAQTFKKIALKMSEGALDSYSEDHLLCGTEARAYMQSVDRGVEAELGEPNPWANYLLTTLLVEERAGKIYPLYNVVLTELGFPGVLLGIIREEDAHLDDIHSHLKSQKVVTTEGLERLRKIEGTCWTNWMKKIETEMDSGVIWSNYEIMTSSQGSLPQGA